MPLAKSLSFLTITPPGLWRLCNFATLFRHRWDCEWLLTYLLVGIEALGRGGVYPVARAGAASAVGKRLIRGQVHSVPGPGPGSGLHRVPGVREPGYSHCGSGEAVRGKGLVRPAGLLASIARIDCPRLFMPVTGPISSRVLSATPVRSSTGGPVGADPLERGQS